MHAKKSLLILSLVLANSVFSQQFYKSKGLQLFNKHEYAAASDSMVNWAQDHASESGIAFYYAGECRYNLACETRDPESIRNHFEKAADCFRSALNQTDLAVLYPEKKVDAAFKLAWTDYRLAELDRDPLNHLKESVLHFSQSASLGNDSLKTVSRYMIAEANLRRAQILRIQMVLADNIGVAVNSAQEAIHCLDQAEDALGSVGGYPADVGNLQIPIHLKRNDTYDERARLYERMPSGVFNRLTDSLKKNTPELTAQAIYGEHVSYTSVLNVQDYTQRNRFQAELEYSETHKRLQFYLLTGVEKNKQTLNNMLDSLGTSVYPGEKALFQGLRDLKSDVRDEAFIRLSDPRTSYFNKAGSDIPEAMFWMGMAQYLSNDPQSSPTLDRYLRSTENQLTDSRTRFLWDHAKYLTLFMRFDRNAGNRAILLQLKKELETFKPIDGTLKDKSDLLLKLVRLSSGEPIWGQILNASSQEERFNEAFALIQDAMVRATRVTGKERVPYLRFLDELFKITQYKKQEETAFYQGMALFLKAEIQETASRKRDLYRAAAEAIKLVDGRFRNEARYIQARSIFAGAKHGEKRNEDYNQAKPVLIDLINSARSLRSLFYLGEIFRVQENDLAARQCYRIVMDKTKDQPEGNFWFQNADAGIGLCKNQGDASVLQQIRIEQVQFPEVLLQNADGGVISLERFADFDYIRRQYHDQAIDLLLTLGLPKRSLYPSDIRIEGSRFAKRDFYPHSAGLMEKLGNIASGLKLFVVLPQGLQDNPSVSLSGMVLTKNEKGFYQKSPIPLNESAEIRVVHQDCYPFVQEHVFAQPGSEQVIVPLLQKQKYIEVRQGIWKGNAFRFPGRSDRNTVFLKGSAAFLPPAAMIRDFEKDTGLRDFSFSGNLNGYIAVHAKKPNLILYRNGSKTELPLNYPREQSKIKSAEGIAVDSKGNLYVVDWQGHQLLLFTAQGNFIRAIGGFGRNVADDIGKPIRFEFPMRIALSEDLEGILIDGQHVFQPMKMVVTDRNGVHLLDQQGVYLTTLLPSGFESGTLSALAIEGTDRDMRIHVFNRKTNSIIQFSSEPIQNRQ